MILTQQKLIRALADLPDPIHVGPNTVHSWVRAGCPTVPGWKKPRFILANVLAWVAAAYAVDPLTLDVRDRLFKRELRRTA